jgi:hypothetical protein
MATVGQTRNVDFGKVWRLGRRCAYCDLSQRIREQNDQHTRLSD